MLKNVIISTYANTVAEYAYIFPIDAFKTMKGKKRRVTLLHWLLIQSLSGFVCIKSVATQGCYRKIGGGE